jgi:hypothetical protein
MNFERYAHISFQTSIVHNLVNVVCRDSWLHLPCSNVQHLSRQPTDLPHPILLFLVQYCDFVPVRVCILGHAVFCVIRESYSIGDFASGRERVDRAQWSSVGICWKWIVVTGSWVGFRNNTWGNEVADEITLSLVHKFMIALPSCQSQPSAPLG